MPLTWQNVAGPNFGDSNQSFALAAELFDRTLNGARAGLDRVDADISGKVNNAFQTELLKYKDAAALEAALAQDPTLGVRGGDRISANSRELADFRVGNLMDRDNARFDREVSEFGFGIQKREDERLVDGRSLMEGANPIISRAREALGKGDREGFEAAINSAEFQALRPDQQQNVLRDLQQYASGDVGLRRDQFGFDRTVLGVEREEAVAKYLDVLQQSSLTQQEAIGNVDGLGIQDPVVKQALLQAVGRTSFIGDAVSGGGGSGGVGGGGSFNFGEGQKTVANTLRNAGLSDAAVAGILGNLEVEGGYGGALGDGGTASGIAQWRGSRRKAFRDRYGKDPHQASIQEQAEFMLWELQTPEGRAVAGINEQQANAILNASDPGKAAELFDQFYERSDGKHRGRRVQAAIAAAAALSPVDSRTRAAEDTAAGIGYSNTRGDQNSQRAIAAYADNLGFEGSFDDALANAPEWMRNIPRGKLKGHVDRVRAKGNEVLGVGLNDAQILGILATAERQQSFWSWIADGFLFESSENDLGNGTVFDEGAIDEAIRLIGSGADKARSERASLDFTVAERNAAAAEMDSAERALALAKERRMDVNNPAMFRRIEQRAIQARLMWQGINANPENRRFLGGPPEVEGGARSSWMSEQAMSRAGAAQPSRKYEGFDASEYTRLLRGGR